MLSATRQLHEGRICFKVKQYIKRKPPQPAPLPPSPPQRQLFDDMKVKQHMVPDEEAGRGEKAFRKCVLVFCNDSKCNGHGFENCTGD